MHNCKQTKEALIDLAFGELNDARTAALSSELEKCEVCRAEQMAIAGTLRVSRQALSAEHGADSFWQGYNHRLQNRLKAMINEAPATPVDASTRAGLLDRIRAFTTSSIRVPMPAALAALALVSVLSVAALSRGQASSIPVAPEARVEVRTVQVPVVQEKVVREVVYRERSRARNKVPAVDYANLNTATAAAKRVSDQAARLNLMGFKPADHVKMTIIKENDQDEK